jgi:hypothetical protein
MRAGWRHRTLSIPGYHPRQVGRENGTHYRLVPQRRTVALFRIAPSVSAGMVSRAKAVPALTLGAMWAPCSRQEQSRAPWFERNRSGILSGTIEQRPACHSYCLPNGFRRHVSTPFRRDRFPRHACGYLLQHVGYKNPRATKRRLPMADCGIGNDETADRTGMFGVM